MIHIQLWETFFGGKVTLRNQPRSVTFCLSYATDKVLYVLRNPFEAKMLLGEGLNNFIQRNFNFRSTLFWLHQKHELRRFQQFFDSVESQPLTELQRRSVILNERRNMVVAGAGTGKTSVIIAKAGYLIESGKCQPEDILLLAYGADAANELSERCRTRLGAEIQTSTFHALGNKIVGSVEPEVPTVSRLARDQHEFSQFLDRVIAELRNDDEAWKKTRNFILGYLKPYKPEGEFRTLVEYVSYVRSNELRALSGDLVKSFAELDIANFLFFNGVRFEYELRYPKEQKRYQPDFYLPDHDIWIEHFGINRKGDTAPYIDRDTYHREMRWKREIHAKNNTRLLETYTWQKSEGVLPLELNKLLREAGVAYKPRSRDEIYQALLQAGYTTQLAVLVERFLQHFKSNQMTLEELARKARQSSSPRRASAFVDLFQLFYKRYQSELNLSKPREIDFNDMISSATKYVRSGQFPVPWKYIIVDEFQDISVGRYLLVEAMLRSRGDLRFFAVGDDWQAIYRFAGSDISIMSRFREFFGRATVVKLDRTFRFNDKIAAVSSAFIQKNPRQIRKSLETLLRKQTPQVFLHWLEETAQRFGNANLEKVVRTIAEQPNAKDGSLLILARYNRLLPNRTSLEAFKNVWAGEIKRPLSIHKAKGLEADYVILNGLTAARYGFPSEIEDDPLMSLVLPVPEDYPNAEERRLFYVALTRARQQVHIIVDRKRPSAFAIELLEGSYEVTHFGRGSSDETVCPECRSGTLEAKQAGFVSCSNFPYCEFVAPKCGLCQTGILLPTKERDKRHYRCTNSDCDGNAQICPQCHIGALVTKPTKNGKMIACHIWPRCNYVQSTGIQVRAL